MKQAAEKYLKKDIFYARFENQKLKEIKMIKVAKFGGSSLADAEQFKKVKKIIENDENRRIVVVSAAGKRFKRG